MNERHDQVPDGSLHPAEHRNSFGVDRTMAASPDEIFDAWTNHFDTWFASPGEVSMNAVPGAPYWFDVYHQGEHYAHYGRFLRVEAGRLIEQTWVTGRNGTDGAETVVRVELVPLTSGTELRLTHSGFYDEESANRHRASWPQILEHLDSVLTSGA